MGIRDCNIGKDVIIWNKELVNLYECSIGDGTRIGNFVEIGRNVSIGKNCTISAYTFIPEGITIQDNVFIGPNVTFCNDLYPPSDGTEWKETLVEENASIGGGCIIIPGIIIHKNAMIGAGSVVTKNIEENYIAYGNPSEMKRLR